jgi:hypothetical protein
MYVRNFIPGLFCPKPVLLWLSWDFEPGTLSSEAYGYYPEIRSSCGMTKPEEWIRK